MKARVELDRRARSAIADVAGCDRQTLVPHPFPSAAEASARLRIEYHVRSAEFLDDWHEPLAFCRAEPYSSTSSAARRTASTSRNRRSRSTDRHQRRPPQQEVATSPTRSVGRARSNRSMREPVPSTNTTFSGVMSMWPTRRRARDRCRHARRIRQFVVREPIWKTERLHRIVETAHESGYGGDAIVVRDPVRPRAPGHLSGHERQRLAALIVDAQEARRPVETGVFENDDTASTRSAPPIAVDRTVSPIRTSPSVTSPPGSGSSGPSASTTSGTLPTTTSSLRARRATLRNLHGRAPRGVAENLRRCSSDNRCPMSKVPLFANCSKASCRGCCRWPDRDRRRRPHAVRRRGSVLEHVRGADRYGGGQEERTADRAGRVQATWSAS